MDKGVNQAPQSHVLDTSCKVPSTASGTWQPAGATSGTGQPDLTLTTCLGSVAQVMGSLLPQSGVFSTNQIPINVKVTRSGLPVLGG